MSFIQLFISSITKKNLIQDFDNLRLVKPPLFNSIILDLLLINEEFCLHEWVFGSDASNLTIQWKI
jgi:hypothetical protein